jgi:hypothetical protein
LGASRCAFVGREQCMMSAGGNVGRCVADPACSPAPSINPHDPDSWTMGGTGR